MQDQIEHAIRQAIGDRVEWPALARSAGDAMPVIMLDGFDELLQAVGVSQTDYLQRVARFQEREAEQGRPVAVIVTSRTAVADRARAPEKSVAIRLEPFDDERITTWVGIWNDTNAPNFAARTLQPLSTRMVLTHRDLAGQPLLLLMLALYDADGNALQRLGADIRASDLYERLLHTFALREITKHRPDLPGRELQVAVEHELRQLSVVAFAMFNRAAQWVTEADLEHDIAALQVRGTTAPPTVVGMRVPLRESELTLGRFFFIHRARASQDDAHFQTYEFLHATFGEFLVARLTWRVLLDLAARDAAGSSPLGSEPADDALLRALLSVQPLSLRAPVLAFLAELAAVDQPPGLTGLLVGLFQRLPHSPPLRRYAAYSPGSPSEPARYAVYSANLLLLVVCTAPEIRASALFGIEGDPVAAWSSQALLWRSQLSPAGWGSLVDALILERRWTADLRDIRLARAEQSFVPPAVDLYWTMGISPSDQGHGDFLYMSGDLFGDRLHRNTYFQCTSNADLILHAAEPHPVGVNTFWGNMSAAHALMTI
ncbi:NACHT domain-containing protein [Actinoplanes sp. HUAS TT8]|uniref:NACHT domain-containing protein n=1 Tax=Actinoplanes sp. HUAS TT8 TaxID=3447453 RepID=UPI003F5232CF